MYVIGERTSHRDLAAENLLDDVTGDLLRGEASLFEDLGARPVLDEFVRKPEFVERRVDARRAKFLADTRADSADSYAVFDASTIFPVLIFRNLSK